MVVNIKKLKQKTGASKCDQSYSAIIKRRTSLIQRLFNTIQRRNSKIKDLNLFIDELIQENKITREEVIERFKRKSNTESISDIDDDVNPFMPKSGK